MNTTTTTTTTTIPVDYSDVTAIVDTIVTAESTESVAWLNLADTCSSADDTEAAWLAARDHYVKTFPKGKTGRVTNPGNTFKARKSDTLCVRKAHPRLSVQAIVDMYGSVRSGATAIRSEAKSKLPAVATVPTTMSTEERLATITAAVRLARQNGCTAEQIAEAVKAGADD